MILPRETGESVSAFSPKRSGAFEREKNAAIRGQCWLPLSGQCPPINAHSHSLTTLNRAQFSVLWPCPHHSCPSTIIIIITRVAVDVIRVIWFRSHHRTRAQAHLAGERATLFHIWCDHQRRWFYASQSKLATNRISNHPKHTHATRTIKSYLDPETKYWINVCQGFKAQKRNENGNFFAFGNGNGKFTRPRQSSPFHSMQYGIESKSQSSAMSLRPQPFSLHWRM